MILQLFAPVSLAMKKWSLCMDITSMWRHVELIQKQRANDYEAERILHGAIVQARSQLNSLETLETKGGV